MKAQRKQQTTPAALAALAAGDLSNAFVAMTPGGIEAQEKAGQTTFVANSQLPKECPRKELEALGFRFGGAVDNIFISVTMPAGWSKRATDHSMWSELIDDKGRKRASIFYKAAFYDRSAHMHLDRRYGVNGYHGVNADGTDADKKDWKAPRMAVVVEDCGKEIHRAGVVDRDDYKTKDELDKLAVAWLAEKFPKHNDATAYWD